eukprot:2570078-Prymnesium_polylepis.1
MRVPRQVDGGARCRPVHAATVGRRRAACAVRAQELYAAFLAGEACGREWRETEAVGLVGVGARLAERRDARERALKTLPGAR